MPLLVLLIASAKFVLHMLFAGRYGYFRDELYYIACSRHLAWGYVDQPPMIALATWLEMHIGGTSLHSLRFLPAVAGAGLVLLTAAIAREMGAGKWGQVFAAMCAAFMSIEFVMDYLMTMNAFEPLLWMGCALIVARIINTGDQRLWLWFGVIAGIGLETKYSMAFFGGGILVGLLLTRERKALAQRWIWLGGGVALAIALPNLIWNIQHGFPFLELMANIRKSERDIVAPPLRFIAEQMLIVGPGALPVWLAGLVSLMFGKGSKYRLLGWAYLVTFTFLMFAHGKNYYLAGAYPMLLAAGAVAVERTKRAWLMPELAALVAGIAVLLLPIVLPVLKVEALQRYLHALPFEVPAAEKLHRGAALPQHFSDQFGWEEMTADVARAYQSLPAEERAGTCIGARNYGDAGAIDFFGPKYGLPHAVSTHQSYFLWGPGDCRTGKSLIAVGDSAEDWQDRCERVDVASEHYNSFGLLFENFPIVVCHNLKLDVQKEWPTFKNWD